MMDADGFRTPQIMPGTVQYRRMKDIHAPAQQIFCVSVASQKMMNWVVNLARVSVGEAAKYLTCTVASYLSY